MIKSGRVGNGSLPQLSPVRPAVGATPWPGQGGKVAETHRGCACIFLLLATCDQHFMSVRRTARAGSGSPGETTGATRKGRPWAKAACRLMKLRPVGRCRKMAGGAVSGKRRAEAVARHRTLAAGMRRQGWQPQKRLQGKLAITCKQCPFRLAVQALASCDVGAGQERASSRGGVALSSSDVWSYARIQHNF